jgi:hypothetical protein
MTISREDALDVIYSDVHPLPDLSGVDLRNADLHCASLRNADLTDACLFGVDLNGIVYDDDAIWPKGFTPPPSA